jgi:hypothetical protein
VAGGKVNRWPKLSKLAYTEGGSPRNIRKLINTITQWKGIHTINKGLCNVNITISRSCEKSEFLANPIKREVLQDEIHGCEIISKGRMQDPRPPERRRRLPHSIAL